jgi:hypothetical protein
MITALTIFNLFAGICSVLGLIFVYIGRDRSLFNKISVGLFSLTLMVSIYVLFIPVNIFTENVRHKISFYSNPVQAEKDKGVLVQKGQLRFSGLGPIAIDFEPPFFDSPVVEVVNVNGYPEESTPYVIKRSPQQVLFLRKKDFFGSSYATYIWVARGVPLVNDN